MPVSRLHVHRGRVPVPVRSAALVASFLCCLMLVRAAEPPEDRRWIAEFEQPCEGSEVCEFLLQIYAPDGRRVLSEKRVPADGCGPQRVEFTEIAPSIPDDSKPPQLRIWSVSCDEVTSSSYGWIALDADPDCAEVTLRNRDGDCNADGDVDISDPIYLLQYLFLGGPRPCVNAADANDDGKADLGDVIFILECIYSGCPALN